MNLQKFEIEIDPVPAPRTTHGDYVFTKGKKRGKKKPFHLMRKCVRNYINYKKDLAWLAKQCGYEIGQPLSMTFVMPMPKSWGGLKKMEYDGRPHTQTPDLDNLLKGFKDALLKNDSMVHHYGEIKKVWGYQGAIIIKK